VTATAFRTPRTFPSRPLPPASGRRRLVAAIAAVMVLLLVLAAGIALGRASIGRQPAPPSTGNHPGTPAGDVPRGYVDGVGVGWPRSRDGAVAAATGYLTGVSSRRYLGDPAVRGRIVRAIVTPDQIATVLSPPGGSGAVDRGAGDGGPYAAALAAPTLSAWRYVPVGYRVDSYNGDRAAVQVWAVQVTAAVGSAAVPATAVWGTTTVPLVWAGGDWKLDVAGMRGQPGPTPASNLDVLSSDLDVVAADRAFAGYGHVAP